MRSCAFSVVLALSFCILPVCRSNDVFPADYEDHHVAFSVPEDAKVIPAAPGSIYIIMFSNKELLDLRFKGEAKDYPPPRKYVEASHRNAKARIDRPYTHAGVKTTVTSVSAIEEVKEKKFTLVYFTQESFGLKDRDPKKHVTFVTDSYGIVNEALLNVLYTGREREKHPTVIAKFLRGLELR